VFEDRTVSPTYVLDAARATRALIEQGTPPGIYHCVNSGHCTWLEFAREAARLLDVDPKLEPIRLSDLKLKAERPLYCALSNEKLTAAGITMPTWQDALGRHVKLSSG
jgi:dTDP-4-dehydrorhamnose reductase